MGRKISDGQSIKATVPQNTTIVQGNFYLLDGFFGMAIRGVVTGAGETAQVVLNIEEAEYETSQINTGDAFTVGSKVYYNSGTGLLTTTSAGNRFVGVVTQAKDSNNVIWFLFMPNSAEVASALGTSKGFITFTLNGTLTTNHKVLNFVFNKAATVTKVKARVQTLPGATHALEFTVKNGADSLFSAAQSIASTDTDYSFKEFTPNATPAKNVFAANGVLSVEISNPGNTAAADLEVVVEFDQSV